MFALKHGDLLTSSNFLGSLIIGNLLYFIFKKLFHSRPTIFSRLTWAIRE